MRWPRAGASYLMWARRPWVFYIKTSVKSQTFRNLYLLTSSNSPKVGKSRQDLPSNTKASGDYDPWRRPDPRREYVLSVAFANQIGDAIMVRGADARRRRNRSGGRYATGARA